MMSTMWTVAWRCTRIGAVEAPRCACWLWDNVRGSSAGHRESGGMDVPCRWLHTAGVALTLADWLTATRGPPCIMPDMLHLMREPVSRPSAFYIVTKR